MEASLGLVETVLRTTGDNFDLVLHIGDQSVAKREGAGHAVDESNHVDRETRLKWRVFPKLVENDLGIGVSLEGDDELGVVARREIVDVGDAVEHTRLDQFQNLAGHSARRHLIGQRGDHEIRVVPELLGDDGGPHLHRASAGAIRRLDTHAAEYLTTRGEVGATHELHQIVGGGLGVDQKMLHRIHNLAEVVGGNVGGHAHGDALGPIHQQVREPRGQNGRLGEVAGVVVDEIDGVFVDVGQHAHGQLVESRLGVSGGGRTIFRRTVVSVEVDQRMAQ